MLPVELTTGEMEQIMEYSNEYARGYNEALRKVFDILAAVEDGDDYTEHWYNLCKAQTEIENIKLMPIEK